MGNRIAPAGGTRISLALLAFALVASLVQVVAIAPVQAILGENGPAPIPGASTSTLSGGQWETKNQHRIWWNASQTRWDAILPTATGWQIARGAIPETFGASPLYGPVISANADDRPDVYWDEAIDRLYVLMSGAVTQSYRLDYNSGTDTYSIVTGPVGVPGMDAPDSRTAIYKTPNGDLWSSVMDSNEGGLLVSRSTDDGVSWAPTPVSLILSVAEGQTQLTHFTDGLTYLGVAAAEDGDNGLEGGRFSSYLFYKLDLANAANWSPVTRATGTLNLGDQPIAGETITVASRTYTFQNAPVADVAGNVAIGATVQLTQSNLVAAINGTGIPGTQYALSTIPHDAVTIGDFSGISAILTARDSSAPGASIVTTETMAGAQNAFLAGTLTGGSTPWTRETIAITWGSNVGAVVHADDELSLVTHNNLVYIASETQRSGSQQGVALDPQVVLFRRSLGGTWQQSTVKLDQQSNTGDRKRPVVAILDSDIYVIAINNQRTNSHYWTRTLASIPFGLTPWAEPVPLFNTEFEAHRNNIVPRGPLTVATNGGLPVLIDFAWDAPGDDNHVWQTLLPNSGNQAPGAFAGADKSVSASPATNLGATVTNDNLGGPVNWAWTVDLGPGAVNFTNQTGQCAATTVPCQLPTTAAFAGLGTYVLRLTATESGVNPLTNADVVTIVVNSLVNTPPTLGVTNPKNGDVYAAGVPVIFDATAIDPQDGNISSAIVWTSSLDGIIGFGGFFAKTNLSTGTHIIKANVTDGQNPVSSPDINITIGGGGTPPPGSATFASIQSNAGFWRLYRGATLAAQFFYGNPGDFGFMGDWNGDGIDTPGLYRRSDGYVYLRNSNTQGVADISFFFGNPGDLPLAGDFDNDGRDTVSIYRPSESKFYIMNHLGAGDAGLGAADYSYYFGNPGDAPFMGDWNGDGIDTPGLRRNSDGFVYLRHSNTQGIGEQVYFYGNSGDVVFTGDWDGDGDDTLGLYRPSNGTIYLRNTNTTGIADSTVVVGGGMQPAGGKF